MKYDVVSIGEPIIDFVPLKNSEAGNPVFEAFAGGGAVNVVSQATAIGKRTAMLGAVGEDLFGDYLLDVLQKKGVDTRGIHRTRLKNTGIGFVSLDERGERSFTFYREPEKEVTLFWEKDKEILAETRIFHFTSVSMPGEEIRRSTLQAVKTGKELGAMISFDVNYRESMWRHREKAKREIFHALGLADLVKLSEEEREFLFPGMIDQEAAQLLHMQGVRLVCISCGEKGSFYSMNGMEGRVESVAADVVDTTGCGDAFMGVLLGSLAGTEKDEMKFMRRQELEEILYRANVAGALCAQCYGSCMIMPDNRAIEERIKGEKPWKK